MKPKDLKGLNVREMMKCDGCGGYHPIADCEIVVIKMIKGKDCELNPVKKDPASIVYQAPKSTTLDQPVVLPDIHEDPTPKIRKAIIPPAIAAMMLSPGDHGFDTNGAKEIRRV